MPVLLPTRDDLARMTPMQRERARRALLRIVSETDRYVATEAERLERRRDEGRSVLEQARELERLTYRERPEVIAERRRILLEATR